MNPGFNDPVQNMKKEYPQVTYGAVYYRRSNPPRADWERDYAQAKKDGMNTFRHWFLWGSIEVAPGVFDWSEYDKHVELAAENGIGTVIAEFSESVPEWFFHNNKDYFTVDRNGAQALYSGMGGSCATGGFVRGGLCMDNPGARVYAERFLRALAGHYKGHPGLFGYDIWNECNYNPNTCFCEHTQKAFREWLKRKYGSLEVLGRAWRRYSFSEWDQVQAPRFVGQYAECLDWLRFRKENYYKHFQWKVSVIESVDPDARITAHGVAGSLDYTYGDGNDDWLAASQVESYGMTWVMGRKGTEPWKQWQAVDLVRAAARGKIFWHAEMQGGPLWLQPQVIGREKADGRVATADDVRLWNLVSLAGGARGVLYLRWRALLDGPLFGAFGLYSNDGTPNDRSAAAAKIAHWANSPATSALFAAKPRKAGVGIVIYDQAQEYNRIIEQAGAQKFYARCQWGAYRMFFDARIPADFVHFDDIGAYETLYFAYPIQLDALDARKLSDWVKAGGRLICEGLPGYFGDGGHVGVVQPNNGLDEVFGVKEKTVEFMPDIGDRIVFGLVGGIGDPGMANATEAATVQGSAAAQGPAAAQGTATAQGTTAAQGTADTPGGLFRQSYETKGAEALGVYDDGEIAVTFNRFGEGQAILAGTFPSEGYFRASAPQTLDMLRAMLSKIGRLSVSGLTASPMVQASICESGDGALFLWLLNHGDCAEAADMYIPEAQGISRVLWGPEDAVTFTDGVIRAAIPGKDAIVLALK